MSKRPRTRFCEKPGCNRVVLITKSKKKKKYCDLHEFAEAASSLLSVFSIHSGPTPPLEVSEESKWQDEHGVIRTFIYGQWVEKT